MVMTITNLTPHAITVLGGPAPLVLPAPVAGTPIPRVAVPPATPDPDATAATGVPVTRAPASGGTVVDLPDPTPGVWLVVSLVVRAAAPGRRDLLSPGALVRGPDGQPTGCQGLVGNP